MTYHDPTSCPYCGSVLTERVHVEWYDDDYVEVVRICEDCPTEYTISYGDPQLVDQRTYEEEQTDE